MARWAFFRPGFVEARCRRPLLLSLRLPIERCTLGIRRFVFRFGLRNFGHGAVEPHPLSPRLPIGRYTLGILRFVFRCRIRNIIHRAVVSRRLEPVPEICTGR